MAKSRAVGDESGRTEGSHAAAEGDESEGTNSVSKDADAKTPTSEGGGQCRDKEGDYDWEAEAQRPVRKKGVQETLMLSGPLGLRIRQMVWEQRNGCWSGTWTWSEWKTRTEWEKRVEEWRASGQDARAYARANGWNERTWTWWIHLLEQEKLDPRDEKGFVEIVPQPKLSAPKLPESPLKRDSVEVVQIGRAHV